MARQADPGETWSTDGNPCSHEEQANHPLYFFLDDRTDVAGLWRMGNSAGVPIDPRLEMAGVELDVVEGSKFNRNLASFTAPPGCNRTSRFSATIVWGDGSTSPGTILRDGSRFRVSGSHAYASRGVYSATVRIGGDGFSENETTSTLTVHDAGLEAMGHFVRAACGREFHGVVAHFRDQNPLGRAGEFAARIDWGDGAISPATIRVSLDGGYDIAGTHTYSAAGSFSAAVRITSEGGNVASACASVRVEDVRISVRGLTAVAVAGSDSRLMIAAFEDSDRRSMPELYSARIDWADGTTSAANIAAAESGGLRVIGEHRYQQSGLFSVRVVIKDNAGRAATTTGTVRVIS